MSKLERSIEGNWWEKIISRLVRIESIWTLGGYIFYSLDNILAIESYTSIKAIDVIQFIGIIILLGIALYYIVGLKDKISAQNKIRQNMIAEIEELIEANKKYSEQFTEMFINQLREDNSKQEAFFRDIIENSELKTKEVKAPEFESYSIQEKYIGNTRREYEEKLKKLRKYKELDSKKLIRFFNSEEDFKDYE